MDRKVEILAQLAHEINRAYCSSLDDNSHFPWDKAPEWQRKSSCAGVAAILAGEITTPGDSHRSWLREKEKDGWHYGETKSPEKKEHPCFVPFEELSQTMKAKDYIFFAVVTNGVHIIPETNGGAKKDAPGDSRQED